MPLDRHVQVGIVAHDLHGVVEDIATFGLHVRPVEVEVGRTDGGYLGSAGRWCWRRWRRRCLRDRGRRGRLLLRIAEHVTEQGAEHRASGRAGTDAGDDVVLRDRRLLRHVDTESATGAAESATDEGAAPGP